jgi:hypothetical protein
MASGVSITQSSVPGLSHCVARSRIVKKLDGIVGASVPLKEADTPDRGDGKGLG